MFQLIRNDTESNRVTAEHFASLYTELENCKIFRLSRNITLEKHLLVSNESNNFDVFNSTHTASHNRLNILK